MKILLAVLDDFKLFFNPKTKRGKKRCIGLVLILLALFIGFKLFGGNNEAVEEVVTPLTEVTVLSVAELASSARFDTIGKVEAVSEANLQAEAGGRITSVSVAVGDSVSAGRVLATIENSAQRAALVQAQGAYEAAVAASAQSGVGVNEAETNLANAKSGAVNTFKTSYNTVSGVVNNNIDQFFSSPNAQIPGLKIDGAGFTATLNNERVAYQQLLPTWQARTSTITTNSNLPNELAYAKTQVSRTITLVDSFITIFNQPGGSGGYTEAELQSYSTSFASLRATLIGTQTSIDASLATLASAEDAKRRAELGASGGRVSASDAQIKMALGSLQSAQSNYQKTIVRSPISGVVNAFYLKTGDYASPGQPAGIIANNNGLQIKTFVSELDSANLNEGDTVTIEGGASGIITAKSAALDPSTGKVAVIIGVNPDSGLTNGATVQVTFTQISESENTDKILVPLSALKITADGTFVFSVGEGNKLTATPVTKGQLYGENIEILTGVTKESRIVTDARGLKEGQEVTIAK